MDDDHDRNYNPAVGVSASIAFGLAVLAEWSGKKKVDIDSRWLGADVEEGPMPHV